VALTGERGGTYIASVGKPYDLGTERRIILKGIFKK